MAQEKKKYTVAGWEKDIKGKTLLSISIDMPDGSKKKFSLWKNTQKKSDNHPDWSGYEDTYKPNGGGSNSSNNTSSANNNSIGDDDDLPF